MSQSELLNRVVLVLNEIGIDYMITGSVVSSLQGEPRSTHDIDIVVALPESAVGFLVRAFNPSEYYLSERAILEAIRHQTMFNLLSLADGEKVDFWILTPELFDTSRFARKQVEKVLGQSLRVSTPEDTILAKLRWAKLSGGSEKQFTDALRVYEVQRPRLDLDYLNHWAIELGVKELWHRLQAEAEPI